MQSIFPKNFFLLFMSLLTVKFAESSHLSARIYVIFVKNVLKENLNLFISNFGLSAKITKGVKE